MPLSKVYVEAPDPAEGRGGRKAVTDFNYIITLIEEMFNTVLKLSKLSV